MSYLAFSINSTKYTNYKVAYLTVNYFNDAIVEGHKILSKRIIDTAKATGLGVSIFSLEVSRDISCENDNLHYQQLKTSTLDWIISTIKIFKTLKSVDVDIIHILAYNKFYPAIINKLNFFQKKQNSIIAHLYYHPNAFRKVEYKPIELLLKTKFFNKVLTTSHILKIFLTQRLKLPDNMVFYIPPIIPQKFFNYNYEASKRSMTRARRIFGLNEKDYVISYIGHIIPQRGIFELLKAFKNASKKNNHLKLLISYPNIVFRDFSIDYLTILKILIKKYKLQNKIVIIGKEDLRLLYTISDLLFFGFNEEFYFTFPPLVVCESMAAGVPFILKDSVVVDELFPERSPVPLYRNLEELTDLLISLPSNYSLLNEISIKIKTTARKFSPKENIKRLYWIYSTISNNGL